MTNSSQKSTTSSYDLEVDFQTALNMGTQDSDLKASDIEASDLEANDSEEPPSPQVLTRWAQLAYQHVNNTKATTAELTIRLVEESEMRALNYQYRNKDKPTNVLSFAFENEFSEVDTGLLGDIVICHSVVVDEATQQSKSVHDHYAHMVVHGVLHLLGYDHQDDQEAEQMEALETKILTQNDIENPYI